MNERIKELAQRLGYNVNIEPSDDETDREYQVVSNDFAEKFAELIVQECADLFEIEWGEEKLTGNDVKYVLKKHFGVE